MRTLICIIILGPYHLLTDLYSIAIGTVSRTSTGFHKNILVLLLQNKCDVLFLYCLLAMQSVRVHIRNEQRTT